jgi:hypothetical protein
VGLAGRAVRERRSAAGEGRVGIISAHGGAGAVVLAARALSSGLFIFRGLACLFFFADWRSWRACCCSM